jgi:hypothetical protein
MGKFDESVVLIRLGAILGLHAGIDHQEAPEP